jgi:RNA polymerase sigma-70 factor (ECF subfamily)
MVKVEMTSVGVAEERGVGLMTGALKPSDGELLARYAATHDAEALDELLLRYRDFAYRLALRFLRNDADAEEAVQLAFVQVMRLAGSFTDRESAQPWIGSIIVNQCRQYVRSRRRRTKYETEAGKCQETKVIKSEREAVEKEVLTTVRDLVDVLPERYRVMLTLRYYENMSPAQLGEMFGMKERSVYNLLERGVRRLREQMAAKGYSVSSAVLAGFLGQSALSAVALKVPAALATKLGGLKFIAPPAQSLKVAGASYVTWTAAAVVVVATAIGGGVYLSHQDAASGPEANVSGAFAAEWSFQRGPAKELSPLSGAWFWWAADENAPACMAVTPETDTVVPLPLKVSARPLLVEASVRLLIQDGVPCGFNVNWLGENQIAPAIHFTIPLKGYDGGDMTIRFYAWERRIVGVWGDQLTNFSEYAEPYPADRLALYMKNATVEKIVVRFVTEEKIPAAAREASWEKLTPGRTLPPCAATDIAAIPPPPPPLNKSWTFAVKPEATFAVVGGGETWRWMPPTGNTLGYMELPETVGSNVVIPENVSIKPFVVTMHLRAGLAQQLGYMVGWTPYPAPSSGYAFAYEKVWRVREDPFAVFKHGETVKITAYFHRRHVVCFFKGFSMDEKITQIVRYRRPYPFFRAYVGGYNWRLERLDLRELTAEEIPADVLNPEAYIKKNKAAWEDVTPHSPFFPSK